MNKKSNKSPEQIHNGQISENTLSVKVSDKPFEQSSFEQANIELQTYTAGVDTPKKLNDKTCGSFVPDKSTTTYDPNSSTSTESEEETKPKPSQRRVTKGTNKYRDHDVCIAIPAGAKGNIRIVGNSVAPVKQVEFALYDAVCGTTPEISSSEQSYLKMQKDTNAFRVGNGGRSLFTKGSKINGASFEGENRESPMHIDPHNVQGTLINESNGGTKTEELLGNSRVGERTIVISVPENIQTYQGESQTGKKSHSQTNGDDVEASAAISRSHGSNFTKPLVNATTLDMETLSALLQKPGVRGRDNQIEMDTISKVASKSSARINPLNKSVSKQSSKKKPEVIGSKIAIKKSRLSLLRSSIPKPSPVSSWRKPSVKLHTPKNSIQGSSSRPSKKYIIQEIVVVPEEELSKQFTDVLPPKPVDGVFHKENVMSEREIRLHDFNSGYSIENGNQLLLPSSNEITVPMHQSNTTNTGTNAVDSPYANEPLAFNLIDDENAKNGPNQNTSNRPTSSQRYTFNPIHDREVPTEYNAKNKPIFIDPATHRIIMEAIKASNDYSGVVSFPTRMPEEETSHTFQHEIKHHGKTDPSENTVAFEEVTVKGDKDDLDKFHTSNLQQSEFSKTKRDRSTQKTEKNLRESFDRDEKLNFEIPEELMLNTGHPFRGNDDNNVSTAVLAYPSHIVHRTPLNLERKKSQSGTKKRKTKTKSYKKLSLKKNTLKDSNVIGTILSFSEPLIIKDSQTGLDVCKEVPFIAKRTKQNKHKQVVPETMVYVGKLPNTTYNVFFSPENTQSYQGDKYSVGKKSEPSDQSVRSDMKSVKITESEKLHALGALGPKGILIFVNKKTELNRNPFDGNVRYADEEDYYDHKHKSRPDDSKSIKSWKTYNEDEEDKKSSKRKSRSDDTKSKKSQKSYDEDDEKHSKSKSRSFDTKSKKSGKSEQGSDLDVTSFRDPKHQLSSHDGVVIERSPSGLKTTKKYPCGCIKITRIDPEKETVTEEITSAFCRDGSNCEISQSQKGERLIRYVDDGSGSGRRRTKSGRMPESPQLDIVVEGLVSRKPIKPQAPAQKMKGANLTGTLTVKTNRCNGVLNLYIDPRLRKCIRDNLACMMNNTHDRYRRHS
ncbi:uncharacterized protein LOC128994605 isoform X1 [Macrosteles quadrilineatus]|uniref:uncharacterized protein LOC128994605 isoform X1 n=1 Tax=Macrosteles quadrilineatus TaxID=74068 RepID=UPI0023E1BD77|nr:uncharacterized protein LOC128994605 isoform X1 [Macrosteles quadrilineatus]